MKRSEINTLLDQASEFFGSGRFPRIIEDEAPRYYLCTEYPPVGLSTS